MTEHFQGLEQEKRERVLNAGYQIFGKHGYRKASTADIARDAGISKAMLFYYFASKRELYLDLLQEASNVLLSAMNANLETISTDFFERVLALSRIKVEALKKHPFLTQFLYSAFGETDPEIHNELQIQFSASDAIRNTMVVLSTDAGKFKEGILPEVVNDLGSQGICISAGSACHQGKPSHVVAALKLPKRVAAGVIRLSFGPETTLEEIDACAGALRRHHDARMPML